MFRISRTSPAYYITCVAHKRLPIFRTDRMKQVLCDAYREACERHGISILAYVIMLDHVGAGFDPGRISIFQRKALDELPAHR